VLKRKKKICDCGSTALEELTLFGRKYWRCKKCGATWTK